MSNYECFGCIMKCEYGGSCNGHKIIGNAYEGILKDTDIDGMFNPDARINLCEEHYNKHVAEKSKFVSMI